MLKSGRKTPNFNISKVVFYYVYLYAVNNIYTFVRCKCGGSVAEARRGHVGKRCERSECLLPACPRSAVAECPHGSHQASSLCGTC